MKRAITGQVVQGTTGEQAEQAMSSKLVSSTLLWSLPEFPIQVSALSTYSDLLGSVFLDYT